MTETAAAEERRGTIYGIAAYTMWGIFPLYFPLLLPATAPEILAHRIIWSFVIVGLVVLVRSRASAMRSLTPRQFLILSIAAVALSLNWLTYVYAVNSHQVVEASLGYFINPLVTVALGVFVLRESLRGPQWVAVGLATVAVVILTAAYGRPPWIALTLAFSFGFYGLLKKQADAGALESLTTETGVLLLPALGFVTWSSLRGTHTFAQEGAVHVLLLMGLGVVTAAPLVAFGAAAIRIPLVTLGVLQYIAPTIQLLLGLWIFGEPMPPVRLIGFGLVWIALIIFTWDSLRTARRSRNGAERIPVVVPDP